MGERGWRLCLSSVILGIAILVQASIASPNFEKCWTDAQNKTLLSVPEFHNYFTNRTDFPNYEPGRSYLTLDGCEYFCGTGFQLWPAGQTAWRFAFFILPLLILGLAFSVKPDLAFGTQLFTFFHLIGNPIDSLWSILIRQEAARRNYFLCAEMVPSASREIAAILTTYDQWWQDARQHFEEALEKRSASTASEQHLESEGSLARAGSMEIHDYTDERNGNVIKRRSKITRARERIWPMWGRTRSAEPSESKRLKHVTTTSNLTLEEMSEIRRIAQRLAANRSRKWTQTWLSIIVFLVSVGGGYIRAVQYYEDRKNSQTAHTLAIVMLFAFLIFAVYINGHVGNFDKQEEVLNTINELRTGSLGSLGDLFPEPRLRNHPPEDFRIFFERYKQDGACAGIINHWRPDKQLRPHDLDDRSIWALLLVAVLTVAFSWGSAFTISYRTPTIGFGCRSFTWTVITGAWVINAIFDIPGGILKWNERNRFGLSAKTLWLWSYARDIIVTLGIIIAIVLSQIGVMNTCWCRAGLTAMPTSTAVEIGPPTNSMRREGTLLWLCTAAACLAGMFTFIAYVGLDGENGRLLFVRSQGESMAEQRGIQLEKQWLANRRPAVVQEPAGRGQEESQLSTQPGESTPLLQRQSSGTRSPSFRSQRYRDRDHSSDGDV